MFKRIWKKLPTDWRLFIVALYNPVACTICYRARSAAFIAVGAAVAWVATMIAPFLGAAVALLFAYIAWRIKELKK